MKNTLSKKFMKYTGVVAGSVLAAHVALLQFPELVSDPLEEYMEEHDIPLALVRDVDTSNIMVYDNDSILAPAYSATYITWYAIKNLGEYKLPETYYNGFTDVYNTLNGHDSSRVFYGNDVKMIAINDKIPVGEYISVNTGIPLEDIKLDKEYTDFIRFQILAHEISHIGGHEYKSSCTGYNKPAKKPDKSVRNREIMADLGSIKLMKNIDVDMSKYTLFFRTLTQVNDLALSENIPSTHETAIYLDSLLDGKICNDLPDFDDHVKHNKKLSNTMMNYSINAPFDFPNYQSASYVKYHLLLDFLENIEAHDDISPHIQRTAELYVEGFEFFAPIRAVEIRQQRDKINNNIDDPVPSI